VTGPSEPAGGALPGAGAGVGAGAQSGPGAGSRAGGGAEGVEHPPVPPAAVLLLSVVAVSRAGPLVRFADAPALAVAFWRLAFSCALIGGLLVARGEWS
jgi:hypothetical protein